MKMRKLAFSLRLLVLFVLMLASSIGLFLRPAPWTLKETSESARVFSAGKTDSTDGTRRIGRRKDPGNPWVLYSGKGWNQIAVFDAKSGKEIALVYDKPVLSAQFVDDNTILAVEAKVDMSNTKLLTFKRQYPEWWWGHFYRFELWLFVFASIGLMISAVMGRTAAKNTTSLPR